MDDIITSMSMNIPAKTLLFLGLHLLSRNRKLTYQTGESSVIQTDSRHECINHIGLRMVMPLYSLHCVVLPLEDEASVCGVMFSYVEAQLITVAQPSIIN